MVNTLILVTISVLLLIAVSFPSFYVLPNRYSCGFNSVSTTLSGLVAPSVYVRLFLTFFVSLLLLNLVGNIPMFTTPSMIYFFSASISVSLWLSLIGVVYSTQLTSFISHMLPFGAPVALSILLPLIELFSHLIRPLTLMIRLSTNLSSGHIILYMFSFFSVSSGLLTASLSVVLVVLFLLEIGISMLQAYIFTSLSIIYINESL